jgi:predicted SAM-dependent methyltransferase
MKSQRFKDLYFSLIRPVSKLSYYYHRFLFQIRSKNRIRKPIWLNLGSGAKYLDSFINIDGNILQKTDMWLDLRNGLPFPNNSVDGIYSCHLFEHFYIDELEKILSECHRILGPKGGMRVLVPSAEEAISAYINKDSQWFSKFPRDYESLGGKFFNFLLCDGQHKVIFDFSFLKEVLEKAGFQKIMRKEAGESDLFPPSVLGKMEDVKYHQKISLIVEVWK